MWIKDYLNESYKKKKKHILYLSWIYFLKSIHGSNKKKNFFFFFKIKTFLGYYNNLKRY